METKFIHATNTDSEYERLRGRPRPSLNHGIIHANLITEIGLKYRKCFHLLSKLNLNLGGWKSVADLVLIPPSNLDLTQDIDWVTVPPSCVIEILSANQSLNDLASNIRNYFHHGVKSCWIVLPSLANIYVFSSPSEYAIFRSTETLVDKKVDISFPLAEVFK